MKLTASRPKQCDYETFGYEIARETRDQARAIHVAGLKIYEHKAAMQPELASLQSAISRASQQKVALCAQLYDVPDPVDDKEMFAHETRLRLLEWVLRGVILTSIAAHAYRLLLFGIEFLFAFVLGVVLTLFVIGVGYLAFDHVLHNQWIQRTVIAASACLMIWGMFLFAQAGAIAISTRHSEASAPASYVDGAISESSSASETSSETDEQRVRTLLATAITDIFISADVIMGILLGTVVRLRTDKYYVTWKTIAHLSEEITQMELELKTVMAIFEVAQRQCMAGILRYFHTQRKRQPPYHQAAAACVALMIIAAGTAHGQDVTREEGILIDASGSIGAGASNSELFREYLTGARQLLLTEPSSSRVVVSLISTESFGSAQELLKGWTPAAHGMFTADLDRARHQLAAAFETKSSGIAAIAAGTDIFGGLWRMKTLLESAPSNDAIAEREIWVFSDMTNETSSLPMPALLADGSEKMLAQAKANGLLAPLKGYKVHVLGASTRNLSSQSWNAIKEFWIIYFRATGATLVSYSSEALILR